MVPSSRLTGLLRCSVLSWLLFSSMPAHGMQQVWSGLLWCVALGSGVRGGVHLEREERAFAWTSGARGRLTASDIACDGGTVCWATGVAGSSPGPGDYRYWDNTLLLRYDPMQGCTDGYLLSHSHAEQGHTVVTDGSGHFYISSTTYKDGGGKSCSVTMLDGLASSWSLTCTFAGGVPACGPLAPTLDGGFVKACAVESDDVGRKSSQSSLWLLRVDGDRKLVWQTRLGGSARYQVEDVVVHPSGTILVVGGLMASEREGQAFAALFDDGGSWLWTRTLSYLGHEVARDVVVGEGDAFWVGVQHYESKRLPPRLQGVLLARLSMRGDWGKVVHVGGYGKDRLAALVPRLEGGVTLLVVTNNFLVPRTLARGKSQLLRVGFDGGGEVRFADVTDNPYAEEIYGAAQLKEDVVIAFGEAQILDYGVHRVYWLQYADPHYPSTFYTPFHFAPHDVTHEVRHGRVYFRRALPAEATCEMAVRELKPWELAHPTMLERRQGVVVPKGRSGSLFSGVEISLEEAQRTGYARRLSSNDSFSKLDLTSVILSGISVWLLTVCWMTHWVCWIYGKCCAKKSYSPYRFPGEVQEEPEKKETIRRPRKKSKKGHVEYYD